MSENCVNRSTSKKERKREQVSLGIDHKYGEQLPSVWLWERTGSERIDLESVWQAIPILLKAQTNTQTLIQTSIVDYHWGWHLNKLDPVIRISPERRESVVIAHMPPTRNSPGSSPGFDSGYAPPVSCNESRTRVWCFSNENLSGRSEVCELRMESDWQSTQSKNKSKSVREMASIENETEKCDVITRKDSLNKCFLDFNFSRSWWTKCQLSELWQTLVFWCRLKSKCDFGLRLMT